MMQMFFEIIISQGIFEGLSGESYLSWFRGSIAIDDISFVNGSCNISGKQSANYVSLYSINLSLLRFISRIFEVLAISTSKH